MTIRPNQTKPNQREQAWLILAFRMSLRDQPGLSESNKGKTRLISAGECPAAAVNHLYR